MRTGPFSDPIVVTLINRYFVAYHMDNDTWTEPRYGIAPGQEDAFIILETPDVDGVEKDIVILNRLRQVLEPENTRKELLAFLAKHPDLHQPWPPLARLENEASIQAWIERAELLLDEGRVDEALALVDEPDLPARAALVRARAHRIAGALDRAAAELDGLEAASGAGLEEAIAMERIRIAFARGEDEEAARRIDELLGPDLRPEHAAEAYWMRGWLYHRAGNDQRAIDTWSRGIELYPPDKALYSQKAYFTMIRANWELPPNVDQPY